MAERDEIATANRAHWEREVENKGGFTVPWLDLNLATIRRYLAGKLDPMPTSLYRMFPTSRRCPSACSVHG